MKSVLPSHITWSRHSHMAWSRHSRMTWSRLGSRSHGLAGNKRSFPNTVRRDITATYASPFKTLCGLASAATSKGDGKYDRVREQHPKPTEVTMISGAMTEQM
eukprot:1468414-Rhodomonas_salina.1